MLSISTTAAFDQGDLLTQQLRFNAQTGNHRLQPSLFLVLNVGLAAFDASFAGGQKTVSPIDQRGNGHAVLSRSAFEVRPAK